MLRSARPWSAFGPSAAASGRTASGLILTVLEAPRAFLLQGDPDDHRLAEILWRTIGIRRGLAMGEVQRSETDGSRLATMAPDAWLYLQPNPASPRIAALTDALADASIAALIEQTEARSWMSLAGAHVERALAGLTSRPLTPARFPVGAGYAIALGPVHCLAERPGMTLFRIACPTSYAPYALAMLWRI